MYSASYDPIGFEHPERYGSVALTSFDKRRMQDVARRNQMIESERRRRFEQRRRFRLREKLASEESLRELETFYLLVRRHSSADTVLLRQSPTKANADSMANEEFYFEGEQATNDRDRNNHQSSLVGLQVMCRNTRRCSTMTSNWHGLSLNRNRHAAVQDLPPKHTIAEAKAQDEGACTKDSSTTEDEEDESELIPHIMERSEDDDNEKEEDDELRELDSVWDNFYITEKVS
jgi:hypothetical protein